MTKVFKIVTCRQWIGTEFFTTSPNTRLKGIKQSQLLQDSELTEKVVHHTVLS